MLSGANLSFKLSAVILSGVDAECHLCCPMVILSFTNKPLRLRIVMLSVNMLSVIMGSVVYAECHR